MTESRRRRAFPGALAAPSGFAGLPRRRFLQRATVAAGGLVATPWLLTACGGDDDAGGAGATSATGSGTAAPAGGSLDVSNWPFYIDVGPDESPDTGATITGFEAATGIDVTYDELVNDNDEWFAKYQADLAAGNSIGLDVVVLTSWMVERLISFGYLDELDRAAAPNLANLDPQLGEVIGDPYARFAVPWASGMAGLAYNPDKTGRELTSVNDLFDPAFAGHVTLLTEMRDTFGLTLLGLGVDPAQVTLADAQAAADKLIAARDAGQFRRFTGNDYTTELVSGDVWVALAWSGDIVAVQADNPAVQWIAPDEGAMFFTDMMCVPKGAGHRAQAMAWIDHVYDPAVSAQIFAWSSYISPVVGTEAAMAALDPALAGNPLMFPPADLRARLHTFRSLSFDEQDQFAALFADVVEG